jgi:hypothetical protein
MECKFAVGQKVVCVKGIPPEESFDVSVPILNKIYTINSIRYGVMPQNLKAIFLTFEEIGTYYEGVKTGYSHKCFKPLDEIRGEMFSKFLINKKVCEDV